MERARVVVIGSGPAGLTAALYASRADLKPVVFEGFFKGLPGGQLMTTADVENYPGFPEGVTGPELVQKMRSQAERFGTKYISEDIESVDLQKRPFVVKGSKTSIESDVVIVASGADAKRLDVPGTRDGELWQKGVTACATCDGAMPIFRDKELFVIGGGDTACEEALFLTRFASKVYIVHRRDQLRASKILADRAQEHPKIEILWDKVLTRVDGDNKVEEVTLEDTQSGEKKKYSAGGVFFAIGHNPNVEFLGEQIELEDNGYIKVQPGTCFTSVEGVFAAGDVQDYRYRQAVTAAGSGCMAALEAENWLVENEIEDA
ncbi:MAG: thioredoxin-disulfide reductase [Chlamydiota bacterium]